MFTIEEADDYFELHLKYDFWKSLDQQTKNAACNARRTISKISSHSNVSTKPVYSHIAPYWNRQFISPNISTC